MGGQGETKRARRAIRRILLRVRANARKYNGDALSRNTHANVEREHLLVIIFKVGCLGAFLQ